MCLQVRNYSNRQGYCLLVVDKLFEWSGPEQSWLGNTKKTHCDAQMLPFLHWHGPPHSEDPCFVRRLENLWRFSWRNAVFQGDIDVRLQSAWEEKSVADSKSAESKIRPWPLFELGSSQPEDGWKAATTWISSISASGSSSCSCASEFCKWF